MLIDMTVRKKHHVSRRQQIADEGDGLMLEAGGKKNTTSAQLSAGVQKVLRVIRFSKRARNKKENDGKAPGQNYGQCLLRDITHKPSKVSRYARRKEFDRSRKWMRAEGPRAVYFLFRILCGDGPKPSRTI